jgi:hypothetical protein
MIAATLLPPVPVVAGTSQLDRPQQTPVNRNQPLELLINSKDCHASRNVVETEHLKFFVPSLLILLSASSLLASRVKARTSPRRGRKQLSRLRQASPSFRFETVQLFLCLLEECGLEDLLASSHCFIRQPSSANLGLLSLT